MRTLQFPLAPRRNSITRVERSSPSRSAPHFGAEKPLLFSQQRCKLLYIGLVGSCGGLGWRRWGKCRIFGWLGSVACFSKRIDFPNRDGVRRAPGLIMSMVCLRKSMSWLVALGLWCASAGCPADNSATTTLPAKTLAPRALSAFYREFQGSHGGRPPKDETEFREFLGTLQERLDAGNLTADDVLKSPKTGAPWIVGYGIPIQIDGRTFIAYESVAVDGKRNAVTERGGVESVDEAKIPSLNSTDR